ncbi:class 1 fructose-bisphosphatase [Nitratifractor sp.]
MLTVFEKLKHIAQEIDKAIKNEDLGYSENQNATGDEQLKLDVASDAIIEHTLSDVSLVKQIISEEKEEIMPINPDGKYTICYDPLDGSSIVDVNFSVGSIFGIYEGDNLTGRGLRAAAYVVYGPRLELVVATRGHRPRHLRSGTRGLFSTRSIVQLKEKGKLNAPGGTQKYWSPTHKAFIDSLFAEGYRLRYSGGMVPDLHQILLKGGGLFSYPGASDRPKGKLRMLFEALPFALIFEAAGGEAIDEQGRRLLDLEPEHIHDTTPCFFGSRYEIAKMREAYGL